MIDEKLEEELLKEEIPEDMLKEDMLKEDMLKEDMLKEESLKEELLKEQLISHLAGSNPDQRDGREDFFQMYMEYIREKEEREKETQRKKSEIYASYGITPDKVEGASEYYNAMFKGVAILTVGITILQIVACMFFFGWTETITVFCMESLAVEAALLSQENLKNVPMRITNRALFLLPACMNITLIICMVADVPEFVMTILFLAFECINMILIGFGSVFYFIYNPYHKQRKEMKAATAEIKQLMKEMKQEEKNARKKSDLQRKKEKARLEKLDRAEKRRSEYRQLREFVDRQKEKSNRMAARLTGKNKD